MNISLLGQGFEATSQNSAGNKLIKFFADKDFHIYRYYSFRKSGGHQRTLKTYQDS